uniref:Uncharacterized protein n=1 Tax=Caenorhabditis japonica TaxID=281687 RepID=A0A8R1ELF8_CAEJA
MFSCQLYLFRRSQITMSNFILLWTIWLRRHSLLSIHINSLRSKNKPVPFQCCYQDASSNANSLLARDNLRKNYVENLFYASKIGQWLRNQHTDADANNAN